VLTSSSAQSTNVKSSGDSFFWRQAYLASRATTSPEEAIARARDAYLGAWIDVEEFERRVAEALGVR
jgi:hypothetical protein